jgi:hypothetical protein
MEGASGRMSQAASGTISMFGKLAATVTAAFAAMSLVSYAKEAVLLAARVETLGAVMKVVGANAKYTSIEMTGFVSVLKSMGISTQEAMNSLIKMAGANMDLTKSAQLARVAQDAAVIGGINSSEAFGRMIQGIRSGEVEILKTLGINVQFEESYEKMAVSLGIVRKDLTATQKTTARMNEVLLFGKNIAGAYAASVGTAGKMLGSLSRLFEELKLVIGTIYLAKFAQSVGIATDALKYLNNHTAEMITVIKALAFAQTSLFAARLISSAYASAAAMSLNLKHSEALRMNTIITAEAKVAATAANVAFCTSEVATATAARSAAVAQSQALPAGQSRVASNIRIIETNTVLIASELALTNAQVASTAAIAAKTAALNAASLSTRASIAVTNAFGTALAAMGGGVGVVVLALAGIVYAFYDIATAAGKADASMKKTLENSDTGKILASIKEKDEMIKKLQMGDEAYAKQFSIDKVTSWRAELAKTEPVLNRMIDTYNSTATIGDGGGFGALYDKDFQDTNEKVAELKKNIAGYANAVKQELERDKLIAALRKAKEAPAPTPKPGTGSRGGGSTKTAEQVAEEARRAAEQQAQYDQQLRTAEAAYNEQHRANQAERDSAALQKRMVNLEYEKSMGLKTAAQYLD